MHSSVTQNIARKICIFVLLMYQNQLISPPKHMINICPCSPFILDAIIRNMHNDHIHQRNDGMTFLAGSVHSYINGIMAWDVSYRRITMKGFGLQTYAHLVNVLSFSCYIKECRMCHILCLEWIQTVKQLIGKIDYWCNWFNWSVPCYIIILRFMI